MGTERQYSRQGSQAKDKYIDRTLRKDRTGERGRGKAEVRRQNSYIQFRHTSAHGLPTTFRSTG